MAKLGNHTGRHRAKRKKKNGQPEKKAEEGQQNHYSRMNTNTSEILHKFLLLHETLEF